MSESDHDHDARLVPAAISAWAAMWVASIGDWRWCGLGIAVAAVIAAFGIYRRSFRLAAVAVTIVACILAGGWRSITLHHEPIAKAAAQRATVEIVAEVSAEPKRVDGKFGSSVVIQLLVLQSTIRGETTEGRTPVVLTAAVEQARPGHSDQKNETSWSNLVVGSQIHCLARAEPPDAGDNVAAVLRARGSPQQVSGASTWLKFIEKIRAGLRQSVAHLPQDQRGLVPALVVGDTSQLSAEVIKNFRVTGMTHLCAVSGSNLVIMLSFCLMLARWTGVRGRALDMIGVAAVLLFVGLCRAEPSVIRAAAMGIVGIAALGSGSDGKRGLRSLAVAVLVLLLLDPWLSRSWGFTLSVLASTGLVLWASRWTAALNQWLPYWIAESIAVPLAAQLVTEPVTTVLSARVSAVGLMANALAGPLIGPTTIFGLIVAVFGSWLPIVATLIAIPTGWCAQAIIWVAGLSAKLPGASWSWPTTPIAIGLIALMCMIAIMIMEMVLRQKVVVVAIVIIMLLGLLRVPVQPGWPSANWTMIMCDVGQGDATIIKAGPHAAIVVDAGPEPDPIRSCLAQLDINQIPLLVLTHDHADHSGGLSGIPCQIGLVLLSPLASMNRAKIIAQISDLHVEYRIAQPGEVLQVGAAQWTTISAYVPTVLTPVDQGESSDENNASIVGIAESGGLSILLTGDLEQGGQQVANQALNSRTVDVLKVPHHGSSRQDPEFFHQRQAQVALISVGKDNPYGHPHQKTIRLLQQDFTTIFRSDQQGSVALSRADNQIITTVTKT